MPRTMIEVDVTTALNCIYTDFLMLRDDEWIPDKHSTNDSILMVERIAEILNIGLKDNRTE